MTFDLLLEVQLKLQEKQKQQVMLQFSANLQRLDFFPDMWAPQTEDVIRTQLLFKQSNEMRLDLDYFSKE